MVIKRILMHPLKNEKYQLFINLTLPKREFQMSLCGVPKKKKIIS